MTGIAGLYAQLGELSRHPTATAAANALARIMTDSCGARYAAVYLRDYTGEELLLSGSAPAPVEENHVSPQRIPVFDTNHPLAYCMQLGRPVTLPISAISADTLTVDWAENTPKSKPRDATLTPAEHVENAGNKPYPALHSPSRGQCKGAEGNHRTKKSAHNEPKRAERLPAEDSTEWPEQQPEQQPKLWAEQLPDKIDTLHSGPSAMFDSFYPLMAPGGQTIGVFVIGHGRNFRQDKHALGILCLYASVIINTAIIDRRNKALVSSLNEDLQRYDQQEQEQQKLAKVIIGTSAATDALRSFVLKAAKTDTSIFITGETGTGKSLVAKTIHEHSHRKDKPFMEINCGSIAPTLLESELFGHVKGAFSGAVSNYPGLLRAADGGTVFLDEIGELPAKLQTTLLHVAQEKTVRPVGSITYHPVNIRLLAATNRSMPEALATGAFRADLYHRLAELTIHIAPLRERPEDIRALCRHLIGPLAKKYGCPQLRLSAEAIQTLALLRLDGNVRELSNILEQCVLVAPKTAITITGDDLARLAHNHLEHNLPPHAPSQNPRKGHDADRLSQNFPLARQLEDFEASIISKAFIQCSGDIRQCAKLLGIHTKTLTRRLAKYGIGAGQRRELWN